MTKTYQYFFFLLKTMAGQIYFSKFLVTEQVFYKTAHCYALVNLKPIIPGHVLVVPLRTDVRELSQLTPIETHDYFNTVQLIQQFIRWHYNADSINIAIQDGPEAGQSVPHLHTHIIPRFQLNNIGDKVYEHMDIWAWDQRRDNYRTAGGRIKRKELEKQNTMNNKKMSIEEEEEIVNEGKMLKPDEQRVERTSEQMKEEAVTLSEQLKVFLSQKPEMRKWIPQ